MMKKFGAAAVAAALLVAGCAPGSNPFGGTKQTIGTVGGAAAGGLLGAQFGSGTGRLVMTGVGALLGAFLGGSIGSSLDNADEAAAQDAAYNSFNTGQTVNWNNPNTGNSGYVQPVNAYTSPQGQFCREYTQTVYVQGQAQTARGVACRNNDGTWQIVS